jgi:hypothetical protein
VAPEEVVVVNPSHTFDPQLHPEGSVAAQGGCSHHAVDGAGTGPCAGEAVVSFQDEEGSWQSGCSLALQQLTDAGEIEPLGQGA